MVSVQTTTATRGDITLIGGIVDTRSVTGGVDAYRVTMTVHFDGDVWVPPAKRSQWEPPQLSVVVPRNQRVGVGLAGRGSAGAQPLSVETVTPATSADTSPTPEELLRRLGDPGPPTEALPDVPQGGRR